MQGKYARKRKTPVFSILVILILILAAALVIIFRDKLPETWVTAPPETSAATTMPAETTVPPTTVPPTTVPPTTEAPVDPIATTASFTVTGDLLMHLPVIQSCWDKETSNWIFDPIFAYIAPYVQNADYAVANLETTLRGEHPNYPYRGNPLFNCPDGLAAASLNAGFDMLLTANNHCYDTQTGGVIRTLEVLEEAGLESLGTQKAKDDPDYKVIEVNGIRVGMTAYTFETQDGLPDTPSINAIQCQPDSFGLINSFDYDQLDKFYAEIGAQFEAMETEGAEAIVVYIHWGDEYKLKPNSYQKKIAQKLCDMGVDVIVGGHPHVIEPVDLLTSSEDEDHKTLIIYSTGNAVSNQRIHEMRLKTGHTEDGILFSFTLVKYSDGTVELLETSCVPTWVRMTGGRKSYTILPLEKDLMDQWKETFQIGDSTYSACVDSCNRTLALVGEGLEKAQEWFDARHAAKLEQLTGSAATE